MNTLLETKRVSFSYGELPVLHEVSLALGQGEVVAILGPNGAGKSTLMNVMGGLLTPSGGEVLLGGEPIRTRSSGERARAVAVVAQESFIPFQFTALEIVLMGRAPYMPRLGFERRIDVEMALHAMDAMDVGHLAGRDIRALSGGERRRVIVARALAQETKVLLLDEPTNFLDIKHATELARLLRDWAKTRRMAVCSVMHDINLAAAFSDRMVLMREGSTRAVGRPHEVMTTDVLGSVFDVNLRVGEGGLDGAPCCIPSITP